MANLSATLRGMLQIFYAFIASLLWTGNTSATYQAELDLEKLRPARVDNHLCSKEYILYQLKASQQRYLDLPCSELCSGDNNTQRIFTVRLMVESNSLLVVTTVPCRCSDALIFQHGVVHVENEMEKCQFSRRYRKASQHCYASDPRENSLECSGHSLYSAGLMLPSMILIFAIIWILR